MPWVELAIPAEAPDLSGNPRLDALGSTLFVERLEWWAVRALLTKARSWLSAERLEELETRLVTERTHTDALCAAIARAGGDGNVILAWGELQACTVSSLPATVRDRATTFEEALSLVASATAAAMDRWTALSLDALDRGDASLALDASRIVREEHTHFDQVTAWLQSEHR